MRLAERDPSMHGWHHVCCKCDKEFGKYIWKDKHWCKDCLDEIDTPGLTPEQRQQNRLNGAAGKIIKPRSLINAGNVEKVEEKKPATMGF